MDWPAAKFDWNQARAFLVTAEQGSLSKAAKVLACSQPTLGRQVEALQQDLGVVLFERVGRGLTLTPSGEELLAYVKAMADAAGQLSVAASGQSEAVEGKITITASDTIAAFVLPPILVELQDEHPGIHVELVASNNTLDLRRREADIAIRHYRPKEPGLIARRLRDSRAGLYAHPDYLKRAGNPTTCEQLSKAKFISFIEGDALLNGLNALGLTLTEANFVALAENHLVAWALVKQGLGISIIEHEIGDAEPGVVRVPVDLEPFTSPLWLTAHRELSTGRRVRIVFEKLASALASGSEK